MTVTNLEDTKQNATKNEKTPCRDKTHSELGSSPTDDADCEPKTSPEDPKNDVSGKLTKKGSYVRSAAEREAIAHTE